MGTIAQDSDEAYNRMLEMRTQNPALFEQVYGGGTPPHMENVVIPIARTQAPPIKNQSILIWAGIFLAFFIFPFLTHGLWSGPLGFGVLTGGVIATFRGPARFFVGGAMLLFLAFGTLICMGISHMR